MMLLRVHAVRDEDDGLALRGPGRDPPDRLDGGVVEGCRAFGLQHVEHALQRDPGRT